MAKPLLQVQMLGGLTLQLDGEPLAVTSSRTPTSLLAFLILHRDRAQTRDLLAGRFWSDQSEDRARRRLSQALWQIKSSLAGQLPGGLELLATTSQTVQLTPDVDVEIDVDVFIEALDDFERRSVNRQARANPEDLAAIVATYRGDLLAGHYDEWIDGRRQQVRGRYLDAVAQLMQVHTGLADWDQALRHARTLVEAEPLVEDWHRDVMRLYALNGQPSAAERHYEDLRAALADELDTEPARETEALIERIRADAAAHLTVEPDDEEIALPFIGRSTERSTLLGRVNELVSGKGGVVLIEAEAGMGKSRLMAEVTSGAEWRGVQVLVGNHSPTSALSPYEGLRAALGPATSGVRGERVVTHLTPVLLNQASTVLPGLASFVDPSAAQALRPGEELWRTTEALARVILAQAKPRSTLLILEDVHWCDEESMQVLIRLGDRLIDAGVLVCLTYQRDEAKRSPPIWRGLAELEAMAGSTRLVLGPMGLDDVRQLATAELGPGRISEPALLALTRAAGGNPYVVLEAVRSPIGLLDAGGTGAGDPVGGGLDHRLLPALTEILSRRIEAVDDDVRVVLEGLAVLGVPASTAVVARAVGADRALVASGLAEAIDLGFLTEGPDGCEFAQDQTRQAVYDRLDPGPRARVHSRIVDALADRGDAGVERLAHHAWQAGAWEAAYRYHSRAAEAARRVNAYQATAEHLAKADQAACRAGIDDRDRTDDLLAYERVLEVLGRREAQQELLDRLAAVVDAGPEISLRTRQRQAWLLANTDRGQDAARLALDTIEEVRGTGLNVGELLTIVGCARAWSGDSSGALEPLAAAIEELRRDGLSVLPAQLMLGRTCSDLHRPELARHHLEAALAGATEANNAREQVEALGHLAALHLSTDDEVEAEAAFQGALKLAIDIGYRHGEGLNLVNLAAFYLKLGRGGRARELINRAGEVFASLGNGRGEAFVKTNGSALAHFILGDDEEAWRLAEEAAVFFRKANDEIHEAVCLNRLACVDRRAGRRPLARRRLISALERSSVVEDPATVVQIHHNLALVELELGHVEAALEWLGPARALIDEVGLDFLRPGSLVTEARARLRMGQVDEAVSLVNQSIPLNRPGADVAHLVAWWSAEVLTEADEWEAAGQQVALAHRLLTRELEDVPPAMAQRSWSAVPEHRAVAEQHELHFVDRIECRWPAVDAAVGGQLEPTDFVDVVLTKSCPDDWEWPTPAIRRRQRILRLARQANEQGATARVSDLAAALQVSERTVKRDLAKLRSEGHAPRLRGRSGEKS